MYYKYKIIEMLEETKYEVIVDCKQISWLDTHFLESKSMRTYSYFSVLQLWFEDLSNSISNRGL